MFLIVGLGNPEKEYEKTRHNVGFMALDEFADINGFPPFKLSKKHMALVSEGNLSSAKVVLVKPQTFMNNSGKAVQSLLKFSLGKTKPSLVVIHDDIDIPLGKIKVSKGSGSAGHKGVDSIIQSLGTKDFTRIRIGIQPLTGKPENVEAFVLKPLSSSQKKDLECAIKNSLAAINVLSNK